ncbi:MAG TPA: PRC-barrel domain-containing protein [Thermodesulfobacteriota bacterium]|nr:PRC-barrel domain-containing protein [Thermodesulfobacteriota bacterium]
MKRLGLKLACVALAAGLSFGTAMAADPRSDRVTQSESNWTMAMQNWGKDAFKGSKMIGATVVNEQGKLGKIEDLMVDHRNGRIPFAVLSHDGKYSAVPINAFALSTKKDTYVLNISKERLAQAPVFDKDNWPDPAQLSENTEIYKFYGVAPYWEQSGKMTGGPGSMERGDMKTPSSQGGADRPGAPANR